MSEEEQKQQEQNSTAETIAAAERLERATAEAKAERARLEASQVEMQRSGKAEVGETKKEESNAEYARRLLAGDLREEEKSRS